MDRLVIFGRSPFINEIDVEAILRANPSAGINGFCKRYSTDYLFAFDGPIGAHKARIQFCPHWIEVEGVEKLSIRHGGPLLTKEYQDGVLCVGFRYYTASMAVNWAALQGFKEIYLVGIDHIESQRDFDHFDQVDDPAELTPETHQGLKSFIADCLPLSKIYQTNPAVADDWPLEYKDVTTLYASPQINKISQRRR